MCDITGIYATNNISNIEDKTLGMNDIAKIKIRTTKPLMIDSYRENRTTGSVIWWMMPPTKTLQQE